MTAAEEPLDAEVVQLHKTLVVQQLELPRQPGVFGTAVARVADRPLPSVRQVRAATVWWALRLARLAPRVPALLWHELRPTLRGVGRVASAWSKWAGAEKDHEYAKLGEGNTAAKLGAGASKKSSARAIGSLVVFTAWSGMWVWLWLTQMIVAVGASLIVFAVFDLIGRAGRPEERPVVLPTGPLVEGFPLSSLRAEIANSFEGQGVEVTVALPYPVEHGWTVEYHSRAALEDENMRQLERDLNIRRRGITQILEKGQAARGSLHVMLRDPLLQVIDSPDPGELTIFRPLPLGMTASGEEWVEHFLRTHFAVAGVSQSGKSSGIWQIVDVLRRCPEVELDAIDLTDGPAFSACRRAFRRRSTDKDGALRILTDGVALVKQRAGELARLAEADDTPDDYDEKWHPTVEDPQRTIIIDEAARATEDDDLRQLIEYILRYGAKTAVTLGQAWQGATTADSGSSIIRAMVMLKILFACTRDDVLRLFGKDARDAGYRPDLFEAANGAAINDAGKAFVMSALSRIPEARRAYRLEQSEVRRRDRELGSRERRTGSVDAVEVPPVLVLLEQAAAGRGFVPTQDVLDSEGCMWATAKALAIAAEPYGVAPTQDRETKIRGYLATDIQRAIRGL